MIHSDVFQRFVEDSPVSVMTQALLENSLSPTIVNSLLERHSELQSTRELLFFDIVLLIRDPLAWLDVLRCELVGEASPRGVASPARSSSRPPV